MLDSPLLGMPTDLEPDTVKARAAEAVELCRRDQERAFAKLHKDLEKLLTGTRPEQATVVALNVPDGSQNVGKATDDAPAPSMPMPPQPAWASAPEATKSNGEEQRLIAENAESLCKINDELEEAVVRIDEPLPSPGSRSNVLGAHGGGTEVLGTMAHFVEVTEQKMAWQLKGNSAAATFVLGKLESFADAIDSIEEPERSDVLARVVSSNGFDLLCVFVIVMNTGWIWYNTDLAAQVPPAEEPSFADAVEWCFIIYYTLELSLKLHVHRLFFFVNEHAGWNIFDTILVATSLLEQAVLSKTSGIDIKFLRILRLLKMTKVLRMLRVLQFVRSLRLLLTCLVRCYMSLFWSGVLIIMILAVFAMFIVQATSSYTSEARNEIDEQVLEDIQMWYGSVYTAMLTLFKCVSGGDDWSGPYDTVVAAGSGSGIVFIFFIFFFSIAVWNIVTAIFIERAMEFAQPDLEDLLMKKRRHDAEDTTKMLEICKEMDMDGSDTITARELEQFMENEWFRDCMDVRGIDIKDITMFFEMLCSAANMRSGEVDVRTFVAGVLRLKGSASAIDVQTLTFEAKLMNCMHQKFHSDALERFQKLEDAVQRLGAQA